MVGSLFKADRLTPAFFSKKRIPGIVLLITMCTISLLAACGNAGNDGDGAAGSVAIDGEVLQQLNELEERVKNFIPSKEHDLFAIAAINEAISAAKNGSFGAGAILVNNETNEILYRGQNKVFLEFRSDLHAEMDLLNTFEIQNKSNSRYLLRNITLFSSLESCPMCLCRIITSGVQNVYHLADDFGGGMVHLFDQLPPVWRDISEGRIYKKAECYEELSEIAEKVFLLTADLDNKLKARDLL